MKSYDFNDDNARWCWRRSAQTQNVVYFWEKPFGDNTQKVSDCVPENYGFNAIKLDVPQKGKKVTADFKALAANAGKDKTIGYRYGLVGITADTDECLYSGVGVATKGKVSLVAPKDKSLKALYLVVMGAPSEHSLDPASRTFPYEVKIK